METKRITIECGSMNYPVGFYINNNIGKISLMVQAIKEHLPSEKDIVFWCRGGSGTIISGIVSSMLPERHCYINHIKKDGEDSHSGRWYEKSVSKLNIIIDDFVRTGATLGFIMAEMDRVHIKPDCLCITGKISDYLLEDHEWNFEYIIESQYN